MATPRKRFTALTPRSQAIRMTNAMLDTADRYLQGKITRGTMRTHLRPLFMSACDANATAACNRLFRQLDCQNPAAVVVKDTITRMRLRDRL